jgi:hypothetical protein
MAAMDRKGAKMSREHGRQLFCLAAVLTVAAALVGSVELFVYGLFATFVLGVVCVFDYRSAPIARCCAAALRASAGPAGETTAASESAHRRRHGALP